MARRAVESGAAHPTANNQQLGRSRELLVRSELTARGLDVATFEVDKGVDLLVETARGYCRVQVKTAQPRGRGWRMYADGRNPARRQDRRRLTFGSFRGRVDVFVAVSQDRQCVWVVPLVDLDPDASSVALEGRWIGLWDAIGERSLAAA
jgi:PD-(D/E)XK endonuclease